MKTDFLQQYNTSFDEIQGMIEGICVRIAGKYGNQDFLLELESQGWILVLETLPNYNPDRGTKVTTYLWNHLNGRILRYAIRYKEMHRLDVAEEPPVKQSTEHIQNSSIFVTNPYEMQPDIIYEKNERASQWQYIKTQYESDIQACLIKTPENANTQCRVQAARHRKKRITKLQTLLHKFLHGND